MTCNKCGTKFCWLCLKEFYDVYEHLEFCIDDLYSHSDPDYEIENMRLLVEGHHDGIYNRPSEYPTFVEYKHRIWQREVVVEFLKQHIDKSEMLLWRN